MSKMIVSLLLAFVPALILAREAETNAPSKIVIRHIWSPGKVVAIEDTRLMRDILSLFPRWTTQPQEAMRTGSWPGEYAVELEFPDGKKYGIIVADNKWSAGGEYVLVHTNFADLFNRLLAEKKTTNQASEVIGAEAAPQPQR